MSKKKIILIILFILAVLGFSYLLYLFFFKPSLPPEEEIVPPEEEEIPGRLPIAREEWEKLSIKERAERGLPLYEWEEEVEEIAPPEEEVKIEVPPPLLPEQVKPEISEVAQGGRTWDMLASNEPTEFATLAGDGMSSLYYNPDQGKFYQVDIYGNKTLLTDDVFYNVENVVWSPTKDKAILEFPDGYKISYNFKTKKQYTLPSHWESFSWNSSGTQIAFKSITKYPETTWLAVARPDGTGFQGIERMGENADKVIVNWSPDYRVVAFSRTGDPRGAFEQEIILIGQYGENWPPLLVDGRGFTPKWSSTGKKLLYSVYSPDSDYKPELYLVSGDPNEPGANKIKLNLNTWVDKCTFSKDDKYVYCAVPREMAYGTALVPEVNTKEEDDFYKIDTSTGEVTFLAEGAFGAFNASHLYVSEDGQYLYFIDKNINRLKYIRIK